MADLDVEGREKLISKIGQLKEKVAYIERPGLVMSMLGRKDVTIGGMSYEIKTQAKVPLFGRGVPFPCVVVSDEEYEAIKAKLEEKQFNGINTG